MAGPKLLGAHLQNPHGSTDSVTVTVTLAIPRNYVVNSTLDEVDAGLDDVCATSGGACTLRAAVQEADRHSGPSVITLPAGTYTFSLAGSEFFAAAGNLNINSAGISINGTGAGTTIIDANGLDNAFSVLGGSLRLNDVTVQNGNSNFSGGCISASSMVLTLTRVVVKGCNAASSGGGIAASQSSITITASTITQNASSGGGGLFVSESAAGSTLATSTTSGNTAGSSASGAMLLFYGQNILRNVTFASNSSGTLGSVYVGFNSRVDRQDTIIANGGGAASANCVSSGSITDLGYNLEFPGTECGFGLPSDRRADPRLGGLAGNGGALPTHALGFGSPAVDAGDDASCAAAPVSGLDQRGRSRPSGAHCDMGAYEAVVSFTTDPVVPASTVIVPHVMELRSGRVADRAGAGRGPGRTIRWCLR